MDSFIIERTNNEQQILEEYKIEIKFFKEKKTSRTYIYNLGKFITDEKTLETVIKDLKKKLATSCIIKNEEGYGNVYGFQGDHKRTIVTYLINNKFVKEDDFKRSDII